MAGFQVSIDGRFWVFTEAGKDGNSTQGARDGVDVGKWRTTRCTDTTTWMRSFNSGSRKCATWVRARAVKHGAAGIPHEYARGQHNAQLIGPRDEATTGVLNAGAGWQSLGESPSPSREEPAVAREF
jgi:hypothetical protein